MALIPQQSARTAIISQMLVNLTESLGYKNHSKASTGLFVASFLGTPPMNLIEREGGSMGFRPENFLPKELLKGTAVVEFPFRVDRVEYLGSEHILYGSLEGRAAKREVTAKLQAHATLNGISPGAWHLFAVRETELRYFDRDGRNTQRP